MTDGSMILKNLTFELIENTKIGEHLKKAVSCMQKAQNVAYAYVSDDSPEQLKAMRIGTALAFSVISKVASGKRIKDFSQDDWEEIASNVADYAILADGRQWSVIVFSIFANYVDVSANVLQDMKIPEEKCNVIRALSAQVRLLEKDLVAETISEPEYTEKCLWLLLEAMIKLIATYSTVLVGEEVSEFIQSVSMLAFEYGRYALYKQEQEILELYIQRQKQIDVELQDKLDEFNKALLSREEEFNALIEDAFAPNIMQRFMVSVALARDAGVDEDEILKSTADIDSFFA